MVSLLFRLLFFVSLFWLINRLWAFFAKRSKQTGFKDEAAVPRSNMVKDPVCGMYMDPRLALRLEKEEEVFYFCSENCKSQFATVSQKNATDSKDSKSL
jgi:YHS domain-containing protein